MTDLPARKPSCPICGKQPDPGEAPFCSLRCRQIDLHRWFSGSYAIPASADPEDDEQ